MTAFARQSPSFVHGPLHDPLAEVHDMGMAATKERWTADMLRALPDDGKRYEIVHGELLVTPAPSFAHQRALTRLLVLLAAHLASTGGAEVLSAPADIELEPDSVVQPDLFVFPRVKGRAVHQWADVGQLLLAIEILSPSTARYDRVVKRRLYVEHDVPQYWIVDLDARCIERWRPGDERPEIIADTLEWRVVSDAPPLVIDLPAFFEGVLEEERGKG